MRPTFKIVLFSRVNKDGSHPVMLRATFLRRAKYYPLHRYCLPDQWDAIAMRFKKSVKNYHLENDILRTYEQRASDTLRTFEREMTRFTFDAFEKLVFSDRVTNSQIIWRWMEKICADLREDGKHGNAQFYNDVMSVVKAYAPHATLQEIDSVWLGKFERWQRRNRNVTDGGMALNIRTLRAACNRAVKSGLMAKTWQPFDGYSFSHLKNRKGQRAIPIEKLWEFRDAECYTKGERLALDLFMFSFYCRGMNMADIAEAKPSDIRDFRLWYTRKKTGRQYSVPIHAAAGAILDRYKGGEYLFPIYSPMHEDGAVRFNRLKRFSQAVNERLRAVASRVGIDTADFSFYVARHCYANAHKQAGTPLEVIRELMGHSDSNTTEAYLSGFGVDALDRADERLF